jgi:hypothetical protein
MLLYPEVATRLGDTLVDASMNYHRLAIHHWIELLAGADVSDTARLQELLYGLDALIRVHLWKDNELFLASLESSSWPAPAGKPSSIKIVGASQIRFERRQMASASAASRRDAVVTMSPPIPTVSSSACWATVMTARRFCPFTTTRDQRRP